MLMSLKTILRCYEMASGLKINFFKLKLTGINAKRHSLEVYAKSLHCSFMCVPFKYLGLEVGGNPRKKQFCEPVVNKVSARLSAWKSRFLSLAGSLCLVKVVLSFIPLFYLSFFKAPESVYNRIICIQRRFL